MEREKSAAGKSGNQIDSDEHGASKAVITLERNQNSPLSEIDKAETATEKLAAKKVRLRAPALGSSSSPLKVSPEAQLKAGIELGGASEMKPAISQPVHHEAESVPSTYIDRGLPIPDSYGLDRLIALIRDPRWIFCYWELHADKLPEIRAQRGQNFLDSCAWVLRLYRVDEGSATDVEIEPYAGCWYLEAGPSGKYLLELALLAPDGEWISLLVSEIIATPAQGPSDVIDEKWRMRPEDEEALAAFLRKSLDLEDSDKRGVSGFLGSSRLQSSFALAAAGSMLGSSASGRPVAGSWALSHMGASPLDMKLGGSSSSGSGGFGWMVAPMGPHEPILERPMVHAPGPNWNAQPDLPKFNHGKTQQAQFKVKLPRVLHGLPLPEPTRRIRTVPVKTK